MCINVSVRNRIINMCMSVNVCVCVLYTICVCVCARSHTRVCACVCVSLYVCVYVCARAYLCMHTICIYCESYNISDFIMLKITLNSVIFNIVKSETYFVVILNSFDEAKFNMDNEQFEFLAHAAR